MFCRVLESSCFVNRPFYFEVVLVDLASAPNIVRKIAGKRDGSDLTALLWQ